MDQYVKHQHSRSAPDYQKIDANSPSIMQSLDSMTCLYANRASEEINVELCFNNENQQNTSLAKQFESLNLITKDDINKKSFQLIDNKESLQVSGPDEFIAKLGIVDPNVKVKVVSIFGNTGDGKSYALNHTFFEKQEIFKTSAAQSSCTSGVWAAFNPKLKVIFLDTEGLLSSTNFELQTTRLLLKILAISDIIIYKTKSERLPSDMFTFLGSASRAFVHYFKNTLQNVEIKGPFSALGPTVVIFHESRHTKPLRPTASESVEDILKSRFVEMKLEMEAFSSFQYVGLQVQSKTDFSQLEQVVKSELKNNAIRSPRLPSVIFEAFRSLNEKFSDDLKNSKPALFPDQYFTCPNTCLSCGRRCEHSVGHLKDNLAHLSSFKCKYQHEYGNCVFICKNCQANGVEQIVLPKSIPNSGNSWYDLARYVWSGYTIECPTCGEIYTSRQYWYGNKAPEDSAKIRTKIIHVWDKSGSLNPSQYTAQKVVDGVTYITEAVANVCSPTSKIFSSYVADQIAPKYWRPNDQIKHCHSCKKWFSPSSTKHHCRNCGEGFCEGCSSHYMPVPKYGWLEAVRVCTNCYNLNRNSETCLPDSNSLDDTDIRARKYGEVLINTLSTVATTVLEYPKELIKDKARPSYWIPDDEILECCICKSQFGPTLSLHHCRDCGRGVCSKCSPNKKPVLKRNWENPVRVCNECYGVEQSLD